MVLPPGSLGDYKLLLAPGLWSCNPSNTVVVHTAHLAQKIPAAAAAAYSFIIASVSYEGQLGQLCGSEQQLVPPKAGLSYKGRTADFLRHSRTPDLGDTGESRLPLHTVFIFRKFFCSQSTICIGQFNLVVLPAVRSLY